MKSLLLKYGIAVFALFSIISANAQDEDYNKLAERVYEKDVSGLKELIESGINIDVTGSSGMTPLILACSIQDNLEIVKYLISAGADINATGNMDGSTPVMRAANNSYETTAFLISKGADLNRVANDGTTAFITALFKAFVSNSFETLELLIENGADINLTKKENGANGYAALSYAARSAKLDLIDFLISNGADVNHTTSDGDTPLIIAAEQESAIVAELLLKNGADKSIKNNSGKIALDFAEMTGSQELIDLLK
ncbi:MAG: ankyrin repeat domain-containing protein [Bacteroidales bacterium]|nr:ankyrin repeat domain-containing protein [Bacteroidales bacterium]